MLAAAIIKEVQARKSIALSLISLLLRVSFAHKFNYNQEDMHTPLTGRGYLVTLLGALCGASLLTFIVLFISGAYLSQIALSDREKFTAPLLFLLMCGAALGEIIGCWLSLRLLQYDLARRTTLILVGLTVPSWLLFLLISNISGLVFGTAILILIASPLVARALTYNPNFPDFLFRITDVFAKRP